MGNFQLTANTAAGLAGSPPRPGWILFVCLGVMLLGGMTNTAGGEEPVSKEYQLKAAFLYNFAKFVEWPAHCFAKADSPIVIGVFRTNPFGGALEKAVRDRKINGRPIVVVLVRNTAAARQTHLLFVAAQEDARLEQLKGSAVLTVGESGEFADHGGMITFKIRNDSLRFSINQEPARQAGLKISAQLQKLAAQPEGDSP